MIAFGFRVINLSIVMGKDQPGSREATSVRIMQDRSSSYTVSED